MYSVSNHSCRGKSILILVAFLHALKQVLCLYYIYRFRENLLLLIDNFLFCWEAFYNHSVLLPRHSQKQHFQCSQYLKENTEKAPFSTSGAASPVQRPRGQSSSPCFSFSRHYIHRCFLDPACSAHQKSMMCLKTGVFTSAYQFK